MTRNSEDIWEFPNISTKKQRAGWYVPETVQHPAKMPTYLVDKIIEEYTKPGDVILDPMGGCGTTPVEAVKKGRNCIAVDYERKFCDLMQKNIDVADKQQTLTPKGEAAVIHGDARNLSSLLGEVDQVIFSPPYAECDTPMHDKKNLHIYRRRGRISDADVRYSEGVEKCSDDPDNIANLKYGKVDQVIFSPPFANLNKGGGIAVKGYEGEYGKDEKLKDRHARRLSEDPNNIDNIKKYGSVDSIVMSPPFASSQAFHDKEFMLKTAEERSKRMKEGKVKGHYASPEALKRVAEKLEEKYSEDPENIGNLKYGSVVAIDFEDEKQTYLQAMYRVYVECFKALKQGGYMVLVVKNFIRNKKIVDLAGDTVKLCESVGFKHVRTHKRKLTQLSFWIINYRKRYPDAPKVDFEHVLVFQKI